MHMYDTFTTSWQRTADRQTRLRREHGAFDEWPSSRRSGLRHPVVAQPGE
jgi:hypothetical protein